MCGTNHYLRCLKSVYNSRDEQHVVNAPQPPATKCHDRSPLDPLCPARSRSARITRTGTYPSPRSALRSRSSLQAPSQEDALVASNLMPLTWSARCICISQRHFYRAVQVDLCGNQGEGTAPRREGESGTSAHITIFFRCVTPSL